MSTETNNNVYTISESKARTFKGIYLVAAAVYANGLDREFDKYINIGRAGTTSPGAGFRYCLSKAFETLPVETVEINGRKYNKIKDAKFVQFLRDLYNNSAALKGMLSDAERCYRKHCKTIPAEVFAKAK